MYAFFYSIASATAHRPFQILLSIAAAISLALGLYQDFGTPRESDEPPVDWVEGVAIMIAISIVVSAVRSLVSHLAHRFCLGYRRFRQ